MSHETIRQVVKDKPQIQYKNHSNGRVFLTHDNMQERVEWCQERQRDAGGWTNIIFCDEMSVWANRIHKKASWKNTNNRFKNTRIITNAERKVINKRTKVHVWAAIS